MGVGGRGVGVPSPQNFLSWEKSPWKLPSALWFSGRGQFKVQRMPFVIRFLSSVQ